jgi:SAM-dependent methyltransferase
MSTANIMVSAALCCPWEQLFYEPALLDSASGDADGNGTVDYYRSIIKPEEIRVLDVGCGTGRLAIPLATDGYEVFAIDSSFEMVAFFQQKLLHLDREIQQRIHLQHLNIQSQICSGNLDVAIAVDDFLTHFLDEVTLGSALQNICHSLRPGGRFLPAPAKTHVLFWDSSPSTHAPRRTIGSDALDRKLRRRSADFN